MRQIQIAVAILIVLLVLAFSGDGDYAAAQAEQENYCDRVGLGIHTHWNKRIDCNDANEGNKAMIDNRSDRVKEICSSYVETGCFNCPLGKPCSTQPGDTKEIFDKRMNAAADVLSVRTEAVGNG